MSKADDMGRMKRADKVERGPEKAPDPLDQGRVRHPDHSYRRFAKQSMLEEVLISLDDRSRGGGLERGEAGQWGGRIPQTPRRGFADDSSERLMHWGETLWEEARGSLPLPAGRIHLRLSQAEVEETGGARPEGIARTYAQLLIGSRACLPEWARITPVDGPRWPEGWLAAVVREACGWALEATEHPNGLPLVIDGFAAADLLRSEVARWLRGVVPEDRQVLAPCLSLRDAAGRRIVAEGRLGSVPTRMVRPGWRDQARPSWGRLEVVPAQQGRAPTSGEGFPPDAAVLTRVQMIKTAAFGAGYIMRGAFPVAGWGPVLLRSPSEILRRVQRAIPPSLADATGAEVAVPALRLGEAADALLADS